KGVIKRYEVVSQSEAADGTIEVEIRAVMSGYEAGPSTQRKRLAVLSFRVGESPFQRGEQILDKPQAERRLRRLIVDQLTQTRRFAVIDRDFDKDLGAERLRLTSSDLAPEERVRLGRG